MIRCIVSKLDKLLRVSLKDSLICDDLRQPSTPSTILNAVEPHYAGAKAIGRKTSLP